MTEVTRPSDSSGQTGQARRLLGFGLTGLAAISFLLVFYNFGWGLLPRTRIQMDPKRIHPLSPEASFAYTYDCSEGWADEWLNPWSRSTLSEDGKSYSMRTTNLEEIRQAGGDRWAHQKGRIVFGSTDNSDPRSNGRKYVLSSPILYSEAVANLSLLVFGASVLSLYLLKGHSPPETRRSPPPRARWRLHLGAAAAVFLAGLYCNTGSLGPYGVTSLPHVDPVTGYLYNSDHVHFRIIFDFVDGKSRSVWYQGQMLRRVLFPVLAWPLMHTLGFELGGTVASLILNTAGFITAVCLVRRRIGERGAVLASWLLALYPGAAYWGGMPYPHALIFPACLLLALGLDSLPSAHRGRLLGISLAMGVAYLGYDLAAFFVPASLLVLAWNRRWLAAALSVAIQAAPLLAWMAALKWGFGQNLENSNTGVYHTTFSVYTHLPSFRDWWPILREGPAVATGVFFGANFLFLPGLFLAALALNSTRQRTGLSQGEGALLASGACLFCFLNLAPPYQTLWMMRGTWIARIYQPVFPALVFFLARWWEERRPSSGRAGLAPHAAFGLATLGNALIVFGPILDNPLSVSEAAFYRFYTHGSGSNSGPYEANLGLYGRRPLGFRHSEPREPTYEDKVAAARIQLANIGRAIEANRSVLKQTSSTYWEGALALARLQSQLESARLQIRAARAEISGAEAARLARDWQAFLTPMALQARQLSKENGASSSAPGSSAPNPPGYSELMASIVSGNRELLGLQKRILLTQAEILRTRDQMFAAQNELTAARQELASAEGGLSGLRRN